MSPTLSLALLWLGFAATHTIPSSRSLRPRLVSSLGLGPFLLAYSVVSLAFFGPLVWLYARHRGEGALLWSLGSADGLRPLSMALSSLGVALAVASFLQPSPTAVGMRAPEAVRGLHRITRHPLFVGLALVGAGHLVVNGFATDVAFFGGLFAYSLLGALHQDARKRTQPELGRFFASTSLVPGAALISGRARLTLREVPWLALVIGGLAAWGVYRLHPTLFR